MKAFDLAALLSIIGALVVLTNIVTEVVKKAIWDRLPTNILAIAVAIILTLTAFFAWMAFTGETIFWYYIAAAIVAGFLVAYAAMFGFDKLKEILLKLREKE